MNGVTSTWFDGGAATMFLRVFDPAATARSIATFSGVTTSAGTFLNALNGSAPRALGPKPNDFQVPASSGLTA